MPNATATYEAAMNEMQRLISHQGLSNVDFGALILVGLFAVLISLTMLFVIYRYRNTIKRILK